MSRENAMLHLYEVKEDGDHFWEVFKDDPIQPWNDVLVECFDDNKFTAYHTDLMAQGLDFVIHFYDEDVDEYHLVLEPQRLVKA
jgi:hypothetical protein